jgi:hypothetical protein
MQKVVVNIQDPGHAVVIDTKSSVDLAVLCAGTGPFCVTSKIQFPPPKLHSALPLIMLSGIQARKKRRPQSFCF